MPKTNPSSSQPAPPMALYLLDTLTRMFTPKPSLCLTVFFVLLGFSTLTYATTATIAVASNFKPTAKKLIVQFEKQFNKQTDHQILLASGATGAIYTQIEFGARYDIFLAADTKRPQRLLDKNLAVSGSQLDYAQGALVLLYPWTDSTKLPAGEGLTKASVAQWLKTYQGKIAIANPKTAPYGSAAQQSLQSLSLWEKKSSQLVRGNNIAQAFQFIATGNLQCGFIARSQVLNTPQILTLGKPLTQWLIPQTLYEPLTQRAVLLNTGASNTTAKAFMQFLASESAQDIIRQDGYSIPAH